MLDRGNFHAGMRRILAFFKQPVTPEEVKQNSEYLEAVYESVSRMDGLLFDTVTKELSKSLTQGRRPVPSQFYAVYEKLKAAQPKTEFKCVPCNTTGWVYVEAMDHHTGEIAKFSKPCPDCRFNHPLKSAPLRQGWIECEGVTEKKPDAQTKRFIEGLLGVQTESPDAAIAEITQRWHAGDFQLDRLADYHKRVTQPQYVEEQRKNALVRAMLTTPLPQIISPTSERETAAATPAAGSSKSDVLHPQPDAKGFFPDGSNLNDNSDDIPF
jgi:hypothetical protein